MINTTIKLKGLTCQACKKLTEKRIGKLKGVNSVNVEVQTGMAEITADRPITNSEVQNALVGTDYSVVQ